MNKVPYLIILIVLLFTACIDDESILIDIPPAVNTESVYTVIKEENIVYAEGLSYNETTNSNSAIPLKLDIYYPDNTSTNRPVYMFIHGGGFIGGSKSSPKIVDMANYYASRGWVFVSIDYRLTENLGTNYTGISPEEWVNFAQQNASSSQQIKQGIAMYAAQRDAKAALRWIVANSIDYNINTDYVSVGGGSAGAITAITLGISNNEDFRDEITLSEDPTLLSTNLNQTYTVRTMIYLWGSNIKLEVFESVYGFNRYDANDPELFMAHGTNDQNPSTPFSEATELQSIFDSLGVHNELIPLVGEQHGAWNATVEGKGLSELSFNFLVDRQNLTLE